jgi:hypothetical protein
MTPQEAKDVFADVVDRQIIKESFGGIMRVEVDCNLGTIRRIWVKPEPEKIEYIAAPKNNA